MHVSSDTCICANRGRSALTAPLPEVQLLAVSGGGENGAFSVGLLCGWSEHGTRPVFELAEEPSILDERHMSSETFHTVPFKA